MRDGELPLPPVRGGGEVEEEGAVLCLITAGSSEEGERIAEALVRARLAACVNLARGVESFYRWEGKFCREGEVLLIVKSLRALLPELVKKVKELHSYSVPEVIAFPIVGGSEDYLKWVRESCGERGEA